MGEVGCVGYCFKALLAAIFVNAGYFMEEEKNILVTGTGFSLALKCVQGEELCP